MAAVCKSYLKFTHHMHHQPTPCTQKHTSHTTCTIYTPHTLSSAVQINTPCTRIHDYTMYMLFHTTHAPTIYTHHILYTCPAHRTTQAHTTYMWKHTPLTPVCRLHQKSWGRHLHSAFRADLCQMANDPGSQVKDMEKCLRKNKQINSSQSSDVHPSRPVVHSLTTGPGHVAPYLSALSKNTSVHVSFLTN